MTLMVNKFCDKLGTGIETNITYLPHLLAPVQEVMDVDKRQYKGIIPCRNNCCFCL